MQFADSTLIAGNLCKDLVLAFGRRYDRSFIVSSLFYSDGDSISVYIVKTASGELLLTDAGTTFFKLLGSRHRRSDAKDQRASAACACYRAKIEDQVIFTALSAENPTESLLRLAQAAQQVFAIYSESEHSTPSDFRVAVDEAMQRVVRPKRLYYTKWNDQDLDPNGSFPVDYRLNGTGQQKNIFHISTPYKAALVSAISGFFQANDRFVPTLSIVNPESELGDHHYDRISLASTKILWGVDDEEIAAFASA
ncbi:MAG: DUF1828 domain-containing protein [Phycisphaerales bacterium JB050]